MNWSIAFKMKIHALFWMSIQIWFLLCINHCVARNFLCTEFKRMHLMQQIKLGSFTSNRFYLNTFIYHIRTRNYDPKLSKSFRSKTICFVRPGCETYPNVWFVFFIALILNFKHRFEGERGQWFHCNLPKISHFVFAL